MFATSLSARAAAVDAALADRNADQPPPSLARAATGVIVALLAGIAMLAWATDGFTVLTTDAARANRVAQSPVPVPLVSVWKESGAQTHVLFNASGASGQPARATIVDFIFTRCITLCSTLAGVYQQLQRDIIEQGLENQVRLLSISFDVAHDSPDRLARYAKLMGAVPDLWQFVTPTSEAGRDSLLNTFGVKVIAEKNGQWQHNAALHVVSADGKLVRIVDINDASGALATAVRAAQHSQAVSTSPSANNAASNAASNAARTTSQSP